MKWETVKLGDTATFVNGYAFKPSDWSTEGKEIIRIQNLTKSSGETNYYEGSIADRYLVRRGDLLISWSATLGVYEWAGADAWLNQHIFKVEFNKREIDKRFFRFLIESKLHELERQVHGATMKHITKGKFDNIPIHLPPLPLQKQIADTLDKADALRQKDQQLLQKYDELAQSIFYEMFGDPEKNEHGFDKMYLGELMTIPNKLVDPRLNPFCDLLHVGGDNIESSTGKLVNLKPAKDLGLMSGKFLFDEDCILYNKIRPYLNKVALPDFDGICSADMYPLYPKSHVNKMFLYHVLKSKDFLSFASSQSRRANIPKINREELSQYQCFLPPLELQLQFANQVLNLSEQEKIVEMQIRSSTLIFTSLLNSYFSN